jgi:hypothetical protein
MRSFRYCIALCLPLIVGSICHAQEDVAILLRRVPESAHALVIVRMQALFQSPRGQQENWSEGYQLGYLNGAVNIPPTVKAMVIATEIKGSSAPTTYGVALLTSKKSVSMDRLAIQEAGEVVTVGNQPVVLTSRKSFLVELAPGLMGALTPADRKELARWLRFATTNRDIVLSPYLQNAVSAGRSAQIQLAVDLKDQVDPKAARTWLKNSKKLRGKETNLDSLFEVIQGLKGIRFTGRVQDNIIGQVYLDFSKPVGDNAAFIKELFQESMDQMGAAIDELADCKVRTEGDGKTVVLRAELSYETLREIMSLITMPASPLNDQDAKSANSSGSKASLTATEAYYRAVQQLLDDLRRKVKKSDDYKKTALWHESYAKEITQLPRQGVDEEMLRYGSTVSSQVWALANSLRGVPLKIQLLEGQKYYYPFMSPAISVQMDRIPGPFFNHPILRGPYVDFYSNAVSNAPEIAAKQEEAVAKGETDRQEIWKTLDQEKLRIRKRMSEKYKTDFDQPK